MHYIIGETDINVTSPKRGDTSQSALMYNRYVSLFDGRSGNYTLHYIRPLRKPGEQLGKIEYSFLNTDTREVLKINFENTNHADKCISAIKGESLPDYESLYDSVTD